MRGCLKWKTWLLLGAALVGCGGDDDVFIIEHWPTIQFSPMYSAFGGTHSYSVTPYVPAANPAAKDGDPVLASTLKWSVDPKFGSLEEFSDIPAAIKITTRAAGKTVVYVTGKTASGSPVRDGSALTIRSATDEDWDKGEARYNSGPRVDLGSLEIAPEVADSDAGAHTCALASEPHLTQPQDAACTGCHSGPDSVPHTPAQTAGYSDEQLIAIVTQGMKPAGYAFNSALLKALPQPDCVFAKFHDWSIEEDDKVGLILKLRSLPPGP